MLTALDDLNAPFRLAAVGNFSTGKSTIINTLLNLGEDVTAEV